MNEPDLSFYEHRTMEKLPTSDNPENDAVVCHASRALQIGPTDVVVDFGCGDGYFISRLADSNITASFVGVDIVWHRRWQKIDRSNVRFQEVKSLPLPFQNNTVDKIFCSQVIEHVPDAQELANEFARVLKPNGRIWLATPNGYEAMLPIFHALQRRIDSVEGHVRHFTASQLAALFDASKFSVVDIKYDLFVCLWLYYSLSYYLPSVKRRAATEIVKAADNSQRPSHLGRAVRFIAFSLLRLLRRIDSKWTHSPLCQVVEITLEKHGPPDPASACS